MAMGEREAKVLPKLLKDICTEYERENPGKSAKYITGEEFDRLMARVLAEGTKRIERRPKQRSGGA